jgi:hypothetical protein
MNTPGKSRRQFLKAIGLGSGAMVLWHKNALIEGAFARRENRSTLSLDEVQRSCLSHFQSNEQRAGTSLIPSDKRQALSDSHAQRQ